MTNDDRFGLSLSLVEALRIDPSPEAAALAELIGEDANEDGAPVHAARSSSKQSWCALVAGLGLAIGFGAHGYAAGVDLQGASLRPLSLQGDWRMSRTASVFQEAVTGPAPDSVTVSVARDDGERLTYQLVEVRGGVEVARGAYNVSFTGAPSTSSVNGARLQVVATRDVDGGVRIEAPAVDGLQASIHMKQTGADTAVLEHDVSGAGGAMAVERISLVRGGTVGR